LREEARERAAGKIGLLCVSFTSTAMWSGLVPNALARFQHQFPGVTIQLENLRSANQIERIRSGRVDLGFVSFRPVDPELGVTCVSREPLSLAVPQAHPLARRKKLAPRDLDDLPWILLTDTLAPRKQAPFQAACARAGITPKSVRQVSEPTTLLALVSSGLGIGLIRKSACNYAPRMVTFLPLPWLPLTVGTFLIRKTGIADPIADAFAAYFPEHTTE
jgi:DNA-binding transcriptional LysR family regulator